MFLTDHLFIIKTELENDSSYKTSSMHNDYIKDLKEEITYLRNDNKSRNTIIQILFRKSTSLLRGVSTENNIRTPGNFQNCTK